MRWSGRTMRNRAGSVHRLINRIVDVRPAELRALGWAWLYIFSVLFSYYILRPIRDEMGVAGGVENLPWLFTGTLLGMIAVNPPFAALVSRLPRMKFIAISYRFFLANLLVFALLLHVATAEQNIWIGRRIFHMGVCFQSLRCLSFLGIDSRRLRRRARKTAVRLYRRGGDPRRHLRLEPNRDTRQASGGHVPPAGVGAAARDSVILRAPAFRVFRMRCSDGRRRAATRRPSVDRCSRGLTHALASPYLIK